MNEPSAYQAIDEAGARVASRSVISRARLKQLVYSVVVITFVSVGAITFSNVDQSSSVSTRDPSDTPVQSVVVFPITRAPTPTPTNAPVPPPTAVLSNGLPQITRVRPAPSPTPSRPGGSTPSGDSGFPSGADNTGKDDDGPPSASSGSKGPSSSSSSRSSSASRGDGGASTGTSGRPGSGSPAPTTSTPLASTSTPSVTAAIPTAMASLAPSRAPSASPNAGDSSAIPTAMASLAPSSAPSASPIAGDASGAASNSPAIDVVAPMDQLVRASAPAPTPQRTSLLAPLPTPKRTTTATSSGSPTLTLTRPQRVAPPAVMLDEASASAPSAASPRPSYLPKAAIHDGSDASVDIVGVSNLAEYPDMGCLMPNYVSKDGKIFAVGPAGETQELVIKGVNWFGMETDARIPYGLRTGDKTGSTLFEIAAFLARNRFNSVRLPISVASVLRNAAPSQVFINRAENLAVKTESYLSTLQSVVKALAFHHISVLISLDTSIPAAADSTGAEAQSVDEAAHLDAIDALTGSLCGKEYWNVMGLDLQNEPAGSTWGDDSDADFRAAATRLGNRMLEGCAKWLAFVEGTSERREWTAPSSGKTYRFDDWEGGGLSRAGKLPVALSKPDKVVYAPHYHSPAVHPASYFYHDDGVSELSDKELRENVRGTFDAMFGYLAKAPGSPALVLGDFGGLYASDKHARKTTQRAFDYTVELVAATSGVAGGYVWSLNPERGFEYNAARAASGAPFREGLVQADWRTANAALLEALRPLDAMPGLAKLQCIKKAFRLRRR